MPPKRKRNGSTVIKGVAPVEKLKHRALPSGSGITRWGWVGSEVTQVEDITLDHRMISCNLSPRNRNVLCHNKYGDGVDKTSTLIQGQGCSRAEGELEDDVIVISDDDEPVCSKKVCKCSPYCLNYLGQDIWEDEEIAMEKFLELANLGENLLLSSRETGVPVGLKNLGATCYANASLQVWFRFAAFRSGVYHCEPPDGISEERYKDSPIFQLQVTFAALQDGNQKIFNPTKLVESLQLRASEQQDAQEFAKLFMTHLDAEFKKQNSPSLKSLITNQFQGTQVYGTICHSCKHRSETTSEFLEIEISFKNNAKLEDCISDSLLPEKLSGENQYLCSLCGSLQDATRYTELRKLPPVLHFSLMRFVYDLNTMERKKSKHSISFPLKLDMSKFMGSKEDRDIVTSRNCEENIYELRGVLLHKGASAYHGHYEAQVYDAEYGSWFLCNDELVTKINALGEKPSRKRDNDRNSDEDGSDNRKKRVYGKKRRRIEDSDDDVIEIKQGISPKRLEGSNLITSKDAYMLIYARRDPRLQQSQTDNWEDSVINSIPRPSSRTMRVVQDFNDAHQIACAAYLEKENASKARFAELRRRVRSIYRDWMTGPSTRSIVVSRQALEAWLSTHCIAASLAQEASTIHESEFLTENQGTISISCSGIICEHGYLDPKKSDDMKCISLDVYENLMKDIGCTFTPALTPSEVCSTCVSVEFRERLYYIEHPRLVKEVDDMASVGEGEFGYWISKKWFKDWRLLKPRMHILSEDDPAPDSAEFYNHVLCEHANLSLNLTNRRKISVHAVSLLQKLFPKWDPLPTSVDPCNICETEICLSKEDKREIRRRIEDEKARLRFILEPSLDAWARDDDFFTILSNQFVKSWKRWLCSPLEHPRPEVIDNTPFFCQHELLAIDPNCVSDLDSSVTIIRREEWDVLNSIYEGGPLIALSKKITDNGSNYQHDIPVCEECRTRRKTEWEMAEVVIRYIDPNGSKKKPTVTYSATNGVRQSKRLRQVREDGKRKSITITKTSTVKDIKIMIQEEFGIPTICQRLFYQGTELQDNSATVDDLRIFANDIIDLREVEEMVDLTSDGDESPPKKQRKQEGNGFNGTLLGNADAPWSSSPEETTHQTDGQKTCPACTFSNTSDMVACQICDTFLSEYC